MPNAAKGKQVQIIRKAGMPMESSSSDALNMPKSHAGASRNSNVPSSIMARAMAQPL